MKTIFAKASDKGRPDYYKTPTRDFTKYIKDCEEKYWNKETAFDWDQDVLGNLQARQDNIDPHLFQRIAFMTLPMIMDAVSRKIEQIRIVHLPEDEDALNGIAECIPSELTTIHRAISMMSPLKPLKISVAKLKDEIDIIESELADLKEQKRFDLFKVGTKVKHIETETERQQQAMELSDTSKRLQESQKELDKLNNLVTIESKELKTKIRIELQAIESQVLADLEATRRLLQKAIQSKKLPEGEEELRTLKDLILKRQIRGLKDIANHALVVEQSAIAPLTMGIIHYKRYREIQEALTTFVNDEAKHSATFRRFLVEKLNSKEFVSSKLIKGADSYMWVARFMPGVGLFFGVVVEVIGASVLEFFSNEKYMPDNLFRSICTTIYEQDEKRHMDLCVAMYNELHKKGNVWEKFRNHLALKTLLKSLYGDKDENHPLVQAFMAFGVEPEHMYRHVIGRLSHQLTRIGMYIAPEKLFEIVGKG